MWVDFGSGRFWYVIFLFASFCKWSLLKWFRRFFKWNKETFEGLVYLVVESLPSKHKAPDWIHWGENVIKTKDKNNRENSDEKQFTAKKRYRGLICLHRHTCRQKEGSLLSALPWRSLSLGGREVNRCDLSTAKHSQSCVLDTPASYGSAFAITNCKRRSL